jgi:predicted Co/Zn/Cd cation transporter (cation efflux family)
MPFVAIDFVASYWVNLVLGLLSLAAAKLLCDEFMFRYPRGTKARLARLVLLAYFALFLYFASYYVIAALRRVLM